MARSTPESLNELFHELISNPTDLALRHATAHELELNGQTEDAVLLRQSIEDKARAIRATAARPGHGNAADLSTSDRQHLETALWSLTDPDVMASMLDDWHRFRAQHRAVINNDNEVQAAHDFWLSRNGREAGFCDNPDQYGGNHNNLQDAARAYGEFRLQGPEPEGNENFDDRYADHDNTITGETLRHALADEWKAAGRIAGADLLRRVGDKQAQFLLLKEDRHPRPAEDPHLLLCYDHPEGHARSLSLLRISRTAESDYRLRLYLAVWLLRQEAQLIFDELQSGGGWRTTQRVLSMEDVRDAEALHRGPGFGSDHLRMFDSRLHELHHGPGGVFFVTAGFDATGTSRRFRVREFHPTHPIAGSLISVRSPEVEHQLIESALACARELAGSTWPESS